MSDPIEQAMADIAEAESELWGEASGFVEITKLSTKERALAEAAFKAGINAGAEWILKYIMRMGLVPSA